MIEATVSFWRRIILRKGGDAVPGTRKGESFREGQRWLGKIPCRHISRRG